MKSTRMFRLHRFTKAREFMQKFPLKGFLLQAPQALYSLTGYGLVLGAIEGLKTDVVWSILQGNPLKRTRIIGPPPSDLVGKAGRYLVQPAYHYWTGQGLSYSDHWLLTAADVIATRVIAERVGLAGLPERWALSAGAFPPEFVPWRSETRQALRAEGVDPDGPGVPPFPELSAAWTFEDMIAAAAASFPRFVQAARDDFPLTTSATALQALIVEGGRDVFNELMGGDAGIVDEFDPVELAAARMFEYKIFPPYAAGESHLEFALERAISIASAAGRDLPGPAELRLAFEEVFGSVASG